MARKEVSVSLIQPKKGSEDAYFAEQDKKKIEKLRQNAGKDADEKYRDQHKYHCFRCGTPSLAEFDEGNVKVDICVNKDCGALHLDPGELQEILDNQQSIKKTRSAFLSLFK